MSLTRWFVMAVLFFASVAGASGGETHHAEGVPWKSIVIQIANLGLLLGFLVYKLRHLVRKHFAQRRTAYLELVGKADAAKAEAEGNRRQIAERLKALEASARESVSQAESESQDLKRRMIGEGKELAAKLKAEAERSIHTELGRAKFELRQELLEAAIEAARKKLKETVGTQEQKRLQNEFVEKIQVVQ